MVQTIEKLTPFGIPTCSMPLVLSFLSGPLLKYHVKTFSTYSSNGIFWCTVKASTSEHTWDIIGDTHGTPSGHPRGAEKVSVTGAD